MTKDAIGEPNLDAAGAASQAHPGFTPTHGIFLILLVGALYYARDFFLPMVLALLVYLTLSPMVRWLHKHGIPPVVSAVVLVTLVSLGLVALALLISDPVLEIIANAPATIDALRAKFFALRRPLEALLSVGAELDQLAGNGDQAREVVIGQPGIVSIAAGTMTGFLTIAGATLVLIVFLLSSGTLFLHKLVRVLPTLSDKKRSLRIVSDVEGEVSRYLFTITLINIGLGMAVGLVMFALDMPNPILWAVAASALNFIPYVGALVGLGAVAIVAAATFNGLGAILMPPIAYVALHLTESAVITPLILGRRLELNAVAIFVALAFWGWMWGIVGALIAVPLLVIIKVFCDHFASWRVFGEFLSGAPPSADAPANGNEHAPVARP